MRWGGLLGRIAAWAIGALVAVVLVLFAAVAASLFTVAVASMRATRATASALVRSEHLPHLGAASRLRAPALQRAAADEASR